MRVSVIQLAPGSDVGANMAAASRLIQAAVEADRPDLVTLPEMWSCLGGTQQVKRDAAERLPGPGSSEAGPIYAMLRAIAVEHGITLHGGSIGERIEGDPLLFNTSLVFGPDGSELARYRKIHLFDVTTPNGQGYRESDSYGAGTDIVTFAVAGVSVGCAICYDLRFAELFLALRRAGADLVLLPAAFTRETGRAHWEVLLRARAIETQCWFAAAATCGEHHVGSGEARATWGHSLICDPWGELAQLLADEPGYATTTIDRDAIAALRARMPVLEHRRLA